MFDGEAPTNEAVISAEKTILEDTTSVQSAIENTPDVGSNIVVENIEMVLSTETTTPSQSPVPSSASSRLNGPCWIVVATSLIMVCC